MNRSLKEKAMLAKAVTLFQVPNKTKTNFQDQQDKTKKKDKDKDKDKDVVAIESKKTIKKIESDTNLVNLETKKKKKTKKKSKIPGKKEEDDDCNEVMSTRELFSDLGKKNVERVVIDICKANPKWAPVIAHHNRILKHGIQLELDTLLRGMLLPTDYNLVVRQAIKILVPKTCRPNLVVKRRFRQ
jgi:hypothetical protein